MDFEQYLGNVLINEDRQGKIDLILDTVSSREDGDVGKQYLKFLKSDGKLLLLIQAVLLDFVLG